MFIFERGLNALIVHPFGQDVYQMNACNNVICLFKPVINQSPYKCPCFGHPSFFPYSAMCLYQKYAPLYLGTNIVVCLLQCLHLQIYEKKAIYKLADMQRREVEVCGGIIPLKCRARG